MSILDRFGSKKRVAAGVKGLPNNVGFGPTAWVGLQYTRV